MLRRRPLLPDDLHDAWWAFADCAEVIEGGRRQLLATLPAGRVDPAPVGVGLDALVAAIDDARPWMAAWKVDELVDVWEDCMSALDDASAAVPAARQAGSSPGELEDLLGAVGDVVEPLDSFADAEREWRRRWRVPSNRPVDIGQVVDEPSVDEE